MRVEKCKTCGKMMLEAGAKKYCSNACRQKSYRQRAKARKGSALKPIGDRRCRYCGKTFQTDNPRKEYCSANHKKQNYREQRQLRELAEMEMRLRTWASGATIERTAFKYS